MTSPGDFPEYTELVHTIASNHPEAGGENRRARSNLEIKLALEQIATAKLLAGAAETNAKSLTRATWTLTTATVVLAVATVILVVVTAVHR
jgi:hypothetical protein